MQLDLAHIIASAAFCLVVILFRCGYRILSKCKLHTSCHRTFHFDDALMAFAILPLLGRAIFTAFVLELSGRQDASTNDRVLAAKFLIVSRLNYAMFLWCLKFCLLSFYSRMMLGSSYLRKSSQAMFWSLVLTFIGVLLATLLECRPLSLFWNISENKKSECKRGMANLLTMAICNVVTDIALIILPIPPLRKMTLSFTKKLQLSLVFGAGVFVIAITTARLPLIIDHSVLQSTRSLWASIEMAVACLVANIAFFYALIKDVTRGHSNSHASLSARGKSVAIPSNTETITKMDSMRYSLRNSLEWVQSAETGRMSCDFVDYSNRKSIVEDARWRPI